MYELPDYKPEDIKRNAQKIAGNKTLQAVVLLLIIGVALAFASGKVTVDQLKSQYHAFFQNAQGVAHQITPLAQKPAEKYVSKVGYEQAIIDSVKSASPSVVSIIISKNVPVYEQQFINPFGDIPGFNIQIPQQVQNGTQYQEVGAGSGFIVSEDGLILTNKHVVSDTGADYVAITTDGQKYPAKVLALDPVQDLAVIKITGDKKFPSITLGDSAGIQIGQGAIAIGNALGQFSNTVSVGVVSGLGRTISAGGEGGFSETLEGVIQTDAAINPGNSGGPLLNLNGEVMGVNVAMAQGAQTIGFAIPINIAKRDIDQIIKTNKIIYPFLGVRYVLVDGTVQKKYKLPVDYGALVLKGDNGEPAITKGSPAEKAGIQEKDIILNLNGEKVTKDVSLASLIQKFSPGDKVTLKILRSGKEIMVDVVLSERS